MGKYPQEQVGVWGVGFAACFQIVQKGELMEMGDGEKEGVRQREREQMG